MYHSTGHNASPLVGDKNDGVIELHSVRQNPRHAHYALPAPHDGIGRAFDCPNRNKSAPARAGTILLVEDNVPVAEVATAYFQQLGCN